MKKLEFLNMYQDEKGNDYFHVYNKKSDFLGMICFDTRWKKWVWIQEEGIIMSKGCLQQIINKIEELSPSS
jgi:hypothetical protein